MTQLRDIVRIEASSKNVIGDKFWLLNLDMVEQQTGNIIDYNYVGKDALNGSIIQFDTGCVLYSKLRPNLNKVVIPMQDGFATSEMLPLRPNTKVLTREYLTVFLRSDSFVTWAVSKTAGAKMPRLGTTELLNKEISLPSLSEQTRIAGQFAKIDELITLRKEQLAKLDQLVKSRFMELFSNCGHGSSKVLLEEISEFVTVGIANSATHAYADSGIAMLRNQNIKENYLDENDLIYITPDFAKKYGSKQLVENDILVIRTGYPGVACLVPKKFEGCQTFTTLIVRLKDSTSAHANYVCHYINSSFGKDYVEQSKVGVAQQNFGAKALAKMPIVIPSMELQKEYASFVEQTDKSKLTIQQSLNKLELLKKSLMQEYFG